MGREVRKAMRTEHHIRQPTLLDYAAGQLPAALSLVAASHLAWCRDCRRAADAAARAPEGPQVPGGPAPAPAPGQTAVQAMDRRPAADERSTGDMGGKADFGLPMPLALCLDGRGLEGVAWRKVLPGVAVRELELPPGAAGQLRLVRMAPGKALPEHGHGSGELTLVLRGAYRDRHGRFTIGDVADLDGTAVHRPVADDTGPCICLVAAETPARYRSWLTRLWQRVTGI
jgi:putative transcriptional regulator